MIKAKSFSNPNNTAQSLGQMHKQKFSIFPHTKCVCNSIRLIETISDDERMSLLWFSQTHSKHRQMSKSNYPSCTISSNFQLNTYCGCWTSRPQPFPRRVYPLRCCCCYCVDDTRKKQPANNVFSGNVVLLLSLKMHRIYIILSCLILNSIFMCIAENYP